MTVFWIAATVLTLAAAGAMAWPLFRPEGTADHEDSGLEVYKDQLGEVDRDLERGLIDADQADALRLEIQRRILSVSGAHKKPRTVAGNASPFLGVVMMLAVAGGVAFTYFSLGNPGMPDQPLAERARAARANGMPMPEGGVTEMAQRLRARLESDGGNVEGWMLLARTYESLERMDLSLGAFAKAVDVGGREAGILSAYAAALVSAANGKVSTKARQAFQEVLGKEPNDVRARFYLGEAKIQDGDRKGGLQDWVNLVASAPADAPWKAQVQEQVNALAAEIGVDPATLKPASN